MSTDNPGAPQQPSGADRPQDQDPQRRIAEGAADEAASSAAEQPTQRIPRPGDAPQEHPTQQLPVPDASTEHGDRGPAAPPAPQEGQGRPGGPRQQQPRYGQMAPGSPYQQPGPQQHGSQQYGAQQSGPAQHGYPQQGHPQAPQGQYQHGQYQQAPRGGYPPAPHDPYAAPAAAGAPGTGRTRRERSVWVPVTSAAVAAAVLASLGTAAATGAFTDDGSSSSSLADVGSGRQADEAPVSSSTDKNPDWEAVTDAVAPSVVAIQTQNAEGSGVVYDGQGHVLTNNHVVSGADTVQVSLSDGRLYEADVVGTDPTTDLAVVQIQDPPDDLQAASVGDSSAVLVGDPVLAVGNPLGLANTATTGIVSAVDRPVAASGESTSEQVVTNAIQIDAAINPGNSGGPLFNSQGQVIGITSSIASLSSGMGGGQSGSIGLGFAIPANLASTIADQLISDGSAEHAFLGVRMQDATATADGVTRRGAQVVQVTSGSPAADAGLRSGDVIVAIDEDAVNGAESLTGYVREKAADQQVTLTYVRDGQTRTTDATLVLRQEDSTSGQQGQQGQQDGQQGQQDGQQGQQGQDDGSQGSDPTQPDNLPDWLRDLLQNGG
ncbi:S1C family serine protease [Isoptericola sp. BMS4]|uniref:S1C family serine protease n=1 Tax=Isoptericola sp. BMS4 TaxID=2527875 RepID=UPI00141E5C1B|nr:trypsin-like peptidase domain-containing protein [Isoptericola sp. BMS4]